MVTFSRTFKLAHTPQRLICSLNWTTCR